MRLQLQLAAALALLAVVQSDPVRRQRGRDLVDDGTWKVASESDDHITYVRRDAEDTWKEGNEKDCNETTTTEAPKAGRRRLVSSLQARGHSLRSGAEGHSSSWRKGKSKIAAAPAQKLETGTGGMYEGGDGVWMVSRRSDDHITYTRRTSGSSSQGQDQGELRRLGTGSDSVYARVIVPGKDDEYTEEGLLEAQSTQHRRTHQRSRSRVPAASAQTQSRPAGFTGFPTNELVHPYVKKSNATETTSEQRTRSRTKSLRSGAESSSASRTRQRSSSRPPITEGGDVDQYPRVGDILNGWIVVSKSKNHISWDRVGASSSSSPAAVAQLRSGQSQQGDRLKSLKTLKAGGDRRSGKTSGGKLIPNPQGELVEGFPRVFNTYSRAFYINDRNIDQAGSIRTSLSDTTNWNVGDELAGWKVISKDYRGIVWQRVRNEADNATEGGQRGSELNEEDLLDELNRKSLKEDEEESSESDSSSESASNEGDNKEDSENVYRGPPGTWYLAKETKNSITWKRDNVPEDVVFEMDAYPRVGDIQTEWKVKSKSREHITWVRIGRDGTEIDSNEQEA